MPITKFPLKTAHLSLYLEEGRGIVFNKINHCLYHLPTLSVAILFSMDDGDDQKTTLINISKKYRLPSQQLEPIYQEIKQLFTADKKQVTYLDGRYPEFAFSVGKVSLVNMTQVAYFKIADTIFSIDTEDKDLFTEILELLTPCLCNTNTPDFVLSIVKNNNHYQLFSNGILVETELSYHHVMPIIIDRLQILSFQNSDYAFCFHGAALNMPQGTLLLPGKSGSGKSTLSAVLANAKGNLFSDEIIAFNKDFELCLLSLPIAVKSGSWKSLNIQHPELINLPTWHRLDGRQLKYIWPTSLQTVKSKSKDGQRKFLIINPQYIAQSMNDQESSHLSKVKKLNIIDTISMLTQSGYQLGFELSEARFEEFLSFICATPCYQLSYSTSLQALEKLDELWQLAR